MSSLNRWSELKTSLKIKTLPKKSDLLHTRPGVLLISARGERLEAQWAVTSTTHQSLSPSWRRSSCIVGTIGQATRQYLDYSSMLILTPNCTFLVQRYKSCVSTSGSSSFDDGSIPFSSFCFSLCWEKLQCPVGWDGTHGLLVMLSVRETALFPAATESLLLLSTTRWLLPLKSC